MGVIIILRGKIGIIVVLLLLISSLILQPIQILAHEQLKDSQIDETGTHFVKAQINSDKEIAIYDGKEQHTRDILTYLEDGYEITIIEIFDDVSLIEFIDGNNESNGKVTKGYIDNSFIAFNDESSESFKKEKLGYADKTHQNENIHEDKLKRKIEEEQEILPSEVLELDEKITTFNQVEPLNQRGITKSIKNEIYDQPINGKVIESLEQGTIIKIGSYNKDWFRLIVSIGSKDITGYIRVSDVEVAEENQETIKGRALNSPTYIRKRASTKANAVTTLPIGTIIDYKPFTRYWYEVTVNVSGEEKVGYIHQKHIESVMDKKHRALSGKTNTYIRTKPSTKSTPLTILPHGTILNYSVYPYNTNWYEVEIDNQIGYVHQKHVEEISDNQKEDYGLALRSPTNVRARASTQSDVLTRIPAEEIFEYKTFSNFWYEVTYNGKTGYVHKNHFKNVRNLKLRGIAKKTTTNIRTKPSTKSKVLMTKPIGTVIQYEFYNPFWFKVTDGKNVGYIHKKHVETATNNPKTVSAYALKAPTRIRSMPSTKSRAITTLTKGTIVNYRTFSTHWHEVALNINGKTEVGFIHRKHVGGALDINHASNPKVVYIDAGHGGSDTGAIAYGLREKQITLKTARMVESLLKNRGYKVIMSRTTDIYPTLSDRTNEANRHNADLFVSIHVNAGGGTGIETYWYDKGPEAEKSKILAKELQKEMIKATGARDRGVKSANFHVNRESKMPSSLVEIGFIDHPEDAAKLKQDSYLKRLATAIVEGIRGYFQSIH